MHPDCDASETSEAGRSSFDPLQTKADGLRRERDEALAREAALADILAAINSSGGELQPVMVAVLGHAVNLCEASFGIFLTYDGAKFTVGGLHKLPVAYEQFMRNDPPQPGPQSAIGRILSGERVVRIEDVTVDQAFQSGDPRRRALADLGRARSYVAVGLFKDDRLLGTVAAYRQEVRPFSESEISLLQTFAAHAVIAIENARLLDQVQARTRDLARFLDELRRTQTRLIQTEKLASLGQPAVSMSRLNPTHLPSSLSPCRAPTAPLDRSRNGCLWLTCMDRLRFAIEIDPGLRKSLICIRPV